MKRQRGKTCFLGDLVEGTVTIVAMQQERLAKTGTAFQSVYLGINVAIGDEKIEPCVIVHVKKASAPADVWIAGLADAGSPTDVVETLRPPVAIERVRLLFEVRYEEAEAAGVVVVSPIDTHVAQFHALPAEGHSGEHANVCEGAVVIVVIEIIRDGIVGNEQVWP